MDHGLVLDRRETATNEGRAGIVVIFKFRLYLRQLA